MSIFNDKSLKGVADAVSKIMEASKKEENKFHNKLDKLVHKTFGDSPDEKKMKKEEKELSPKQKAIAKMDHPKHKIDAGDLAKLRAGHKPVKEEKESCEDEAEEAVDKHEKKMHGKKGEVAKHEKEMHKESFTSLIESYKKEGLKSLSKMKKMNEEPDNEQFTKEVEDQKKSMKGEKKQPSVAAPATQGVKIMPEETEELDEAERMKGEDPCWKDYEMVGHKMKNGKKVPNCVPKNEEVEVELEERTLTEPETKKKEEIVKSMKKNVKGFKERYGSRAKEVMYATATARAKENA